MELHQAAKMGDAKKIKKVLETGRVYVDCQDPEVSTKPSKVIQKSLIHFQDGITPLMLTILGKSQDCLNVLLQEGADPNMKKKVSKLKMIPPQNF